MGEVHEARDSRLGRTVAIKVLPERLSSQPDLRDRFAREARLLSSLNHPHICALYDIGRHEEMDYLVLERLEGETLAQRLRRGPLPIEELLRLGVAIADALAAAHKQRIVHRDLKPSNVMISNEGWVKVLDFGLAALAEGAPRSLAPDDTSTVDLGTRPGAILGTLPYMSPEQATRRDVDGRTDLFSLGAVLYEAATGRRPFSGAAEAEVLAMILRDHPTPVHEVDSKLPRSLGRIIARCLEKDPERRHAGASDLRSELAALHDEVRSARPIRAAGTDEREGLRAIAVLPLDDLTGDSSQSWFADGMTEAIITGLARIRGLRVIARNSVMRFRCCAKPPREVASELGVGAIVTGSILRAGERIRINAQLADGRTDELLWAQSYERDLRDVLALQSEVAQAVAREIQVTLTPQDRARLDRHRPVSPAAWDAYLRGRHHWNRRTEEEVRRGIDCFRDAIDADPGWALGHVGLADSYAILGFYSLMPPQEAFPRSKAAAEKALELDPDLGEARVSVAYAKHYHDWDWAGSEREYRLPSKPTPSTRPRISSTTTCWSLWVVSTRLWSNRGGRWSWTLCR